MYWPLVDRMLESASWGGVCSWGVSGLGGGGGVCSGGVVSAPGGVCSWGVLPARRHNLGHNFVAAGKNNEKIPGNLLKNLEKSWKYHGILSVRKSGNPVN